MGQSRGQIPAKAAHPSLTPAPIFAVRRPGALANPGEHVPGPGGKCLPDGRGGMSPPGGSCASKRWVSKSAGGLERAALRGPRPLIAREGSMNLTGAAVAADASTTAVRYAHDRHLAKRGASVSGQAPPAGGLRERKKALTRATIEAKALERFLDAGFEQARLEDICADAMVSLRTFFRYFTSKEDLVFSRLRSHLDLTEELFARRPTDEPLLASMRAVIDQALADYSAERERELVRLRLVADTPALQAGMATVFSGFEQFARRVAATRLCEADDARRPRLVAAASVAAFRVGLDVWVASDARPDLARLVLDNLDDLTTGMLTRSAAGTGEDTGSVR